MHRCLIALMPCLCLGQPLAGTRPLEATGDVALQMVDRIHQFLDQYRSPRAPRPDPQKLAQILGVVDPRVRPVSMELIESHDNRFRGESKGFTVRAVRWQALPGVSGEGLLLMPRTKPTARWVAIPDAGQTPEEFMQDIPARLAARGAAVVVPVLIDRGNQFSEVPGMKRTSISHRDFLYRLSFPLGRHVLGFEIQKVLAAVDWLDGPVSVAGHGEGALIAHYAAALDSRIQGTHLVNFPSPERELWRQPLEHNVFDLYSVERPQSRTISIPEGTADPIRTEGTPPDPVARQKRQIQEIIGYTQKLVRRSPAEREAFWANAGNDPQRLRDSYWERVLGRLPDPSAPVNARSRLVSDTPKFRGYEVMLDVWLGVFAYGLLLVPKDIRPGERRSVVVCQHGLEGRPHDLADPQRNNPTYNQFAVRLAEQGFVTFSPQNPYTGGERFRTLQRKAHPWGLSIFSFIVGQHQRILEWLGALDFVDRSRIGFYGLSYGGYTAMRVPALLPGYALSICSANFNEWIWKTATLDAPFVYAFAPDYEITEWNLASGFNYSELAKLIFPRPFFVERGHRDGVSWDEWVAYEFAKVQRHYDAAGLGERAGIEYFDGAHVIHGKGTFEFLKRWLR